MQIQHAALQQLAVMSPVELCVAGVGRELFRLLETAEDTQQGGFARAIFAGQQGAATGTQAQFQPRQNRAPGVVFMDVAEMQCTHEPTNPLP